MTHPDEGQLHAYLDGETRGDERGRKEIESHLAECPLCRSRLEEARRVRDRARAILSTAGPASLSPPPFDLVVQRAARKRERRPTMRPRVALAWAASLALAITVGWYARGVVVGSGETGLVEAAGAPSSEPVRTGAIEASPPATRQVAQVTSGRLDTAQRRQEAPDTVAATTMADAAAAPAAAAAPPAPVANLAAAEAKVARDTETAPARPTETQPAGDVRATRAPPPAAALDEVVVAAPPRVAAPEVAEGAWITVSPAEAERRLNGPLAVIPGLPSLGTSVSGSGPATVARTIQVLGPGLTIELLQQHPAAGTVERAARERVAAPAAMPSARRAAGAEPGRWLTVEWEGFSVTGRALVPADSLQRLLGRLRRP